MKVHFHATLRPVAGGRTVEIPLPDGATLRELVDAVVEALPPLAPLLLDDAGELGRHVHVFVNGRDAPHLPARLDTRLAETDSVDFFPSVAGGAG